MRHCPLEARILDLALSVNFKAHIFNPSGTLRNLTSFVMVPTTATILELNAVLPSGSLELLLERILAILEMEMGYLLSRDWLRRLWTIELNLESVLRWRKE